MKEFIDKLIGRLEEQRKFLENTYLLSKKSYEVKKDAVARINELGGAIEIINGLAEEYKGGWIACSERLPEENQIVMCSVKKEYASHRIVLQRFDNKEYWHNGIIEAWMPLPAPYTEGEKA